MGLVCWCDKAQRQTIGFCLVLQRSSIFHTFPWNFELKFAIFFERHEMQNGKRDLTRNEFALIFDDKFQLKHAVAYLMAFRCSWQMGVTAAASSPDATDNYYDSAREFVCMAAVRQKK